MKKALFISSAGGHLHELLSLDKTIRAFDSYIVTEKNPTTEYLKDKFNNTGFLPFFSRQNKIKSLFIFIAICIKSIFLYFKIKPDVVISTGAGSVIPMLFISHIFGKKIIYIETFSRTQSRTLTGRLCYPITDVFIVQWKELLKLYPKAKYFGAIY